MSGYSDLTVYESDAERSAVCAELARMLRIVPPTLSPAPAAAPLSGVAPPGPSGAGDPLVEQNA